LIYNEEQIYLWFENIGGKFRVILRLFCMEIEAKKVAEFVHVNCVIINRIFDKLRERIVALCEAESPFETGEVELDESYFGARRVRGIRGRGAKGKIPVFGMLKRNGNVYTQVVHNCSMAELVPIIERRTKKKEETTLYTDGLADLALPGQARGE
jgi:transposase